MGSSGSGSFTDYSDQKPTDINHENGGSNRIDRCNLAFATSLQEVSRCRYFEERGIPPTGTAVILRFNGIRLVIVETMSGDEIGYLPTSFNYMKNCLDDGFAYSGIVSNNSITPTPHVFVDMIPS